MKATVNKETCEGCAVCIEICPDVFEMDDANQASVTKEPIPVELEEECRDAADQCPTEAIHIQAE